MSQEWYISLRLVKEVVPLIRQRMKFDCVLLVLHHALTGLNSRYRKVITLFELQGLSGREIAELEGVPVGTVWVWLHRARAELATRVARLRAPASRTRA